MPKRSPRPDTVKQAIRIANESFTPQQVIDALLKHDGFLSYAAKELDCSPATIARYVRVYPEVAEAQATALERQHDKAERRLMDLINDGVPAAVIFYAKTRLRHKGYSERVTLELVPWNLQQQLAELCAAQGLTVEDLLERVVEQLQSSQSDVISLPSGE